MSDEAVTRRSFIVSGLTLTFSLLAWKPSLAAAAVADADERDFMALSTALTGFDDLPASLGRKYLEALRASFPGDQAWRRLFSAFNRGGVKAAREQSPDLSKEILLAWYQGTVASKEPLLAYEKALAWRCLPYAKTPGSCGGTLGYWRYAPGNR